MYKEPKVGRPPKPTEEKMDQPFRCLGTQRVKDYWRARAEALGLTESQLLRLAIYMLMTPWSGAPLDDPMFDEVEK